MRGDNKGDLLSHIDDRIRRIAREVFEDDRKDERDAARSLDADVSQFSETLQRLMVKEFLSTKEVALLLNCSDGHVRNLVAKAQNGKASNPIPFFDLDGVTVFPRLKLLEWAKQPKRNLRAVG